MVSTFLLILINFAVLLAMFLYFNARIKKTLSTEEILKTVREEIDQMIVELNQTTNRNIGLIEESIRRLSDILRQADKSVAILNKETDRRKQSEEVYTKLKPKSIPIQPTEKPSEKLKSVQDKVLDLHRKGLGPSVISNRLDMSVGEIELIISIHGRKE